MLASVQKINKLTPIEGADKIKTATVLGWQVVVKKGDFKEGNLCRDVLMIIYLSKL